MTSSNEMVWLRRLLPRGNSGIKNPTLSWTARTYNLALYLLGAVTLLQLQTVPVRDVGGLVAFLIIGGLAQLLPVRFSKNASVSMTMAVALAAVLAFGPVFAVWVNLASGIVHYWTQIRPKRRPFYRSAVTTSTLMIAAWVAGNVYVGVGGEVGPGSESFLSLLPLTAASLAYYAVNTVLITGAIALEQRRNLRELLKSNYQWLTVNVASMTPLGFGISFVYQKLGLTGMVLFLLPIGMAWYSFRLYARTTEDVRKANEDLKEASEHVRETNEELVEANARVQKANEELKEANERLNIMYEVSRSLVGALYLEDTLNRIVAATKLMGFPAGFVAGPISERGAKILHWRANHPAYAQWVLTEPDRATETTLRKIIAAVGREPWFTAGETRVLSSLELGLRTADYHVSDAGQDPLSKLTLAPLLIRDQSKWVVGVGSQKEPAPIDIKEFWIFRTIAESALEMALAHEQAERDALSDAGTGLYNHRYFQEALQRELEEAARQAYCLSFLMIDVNRFKELNDVYGHLAGDQVLQIVAQLLRANVRETDTPCRYGGDEMCVLLPRTDRARAVEIAERIDRAIRNYQFRARRENSSGEGQVEEVSLRVSIGVASFPESAQTRAGLVEQADRACYRAKTLKGGVATSDGHQRESRPTLDLTFPDGPKLRLDRSDPRVLLPHLPNPTDLTARIENRNFASVAADPLIPFLKIPYTHLFLQVARAVD